MLVKSPVFKLAIVRTAGKAMSRTAAASRLSD
jgi:hypothetical protein